MGQALYRKYRSRSLGEVIGQEHITQTLAGAIKAGRISHAYLLTGPRGTGKTSVARILAFEINNIPYSDAPQLDIIEIDAASNRRIDDIRDLREKVHIAPVNAPYKVYIIDEVHMLTGESFNALLKTLEEPPSHVVFILATTEAHKLPATIISRTQRFAFRPVERTKVMAHLRSIADNESINIADDALAMVAEHGEGSFRDSISLLDQLSHVSAGEITAEDVTRTLGLAPHKQINDLTSALVAGDRGAIIAQLQLIETSGANTAALVTQLTKQLAEVAPEHPHLYEMMDQLLDVPRAYNPSLKLLTVLMKSVPAAPAEPPKRAAALDIKAPVVEISAPVPKPKSAPVAEVTHAKAEPVPEIEPLTSFDLTQWAVVLAAVKKASAPLFSVAKQASPSFDAESNVLTLTFKYQLHSKKLDDVKQKANLASIMNATLGATPTIKVAVDKTTLPPVLSEDPAVSSVAAIMGGGEVVDASI